MTIVADAHQARAASYASRSLTSGERLCATPTGEAHVRADTLTANDRATLALLFPGVHTFDARLHAEPCLDVALAVRAQDAAYPPPDVRGTRKGFKAWFDSDEYLGRWVATVDGAVAGHIGLTAAHPYLGRVLGPVAGRAEISRLCVHPDYRRHGIGSRLLATAVGHARSLGLAPALAVLDTTPGAIRLYESRGWAYRGRFAGEQGINHVFVR